MEWFNSFYLKYIISALIGGWENSTMEGIIGFKLGIPDPSKLEEAIRLAIE
jgi:hypothetical protein